MDKRLMQLAGLLKEGQEPPKEEGGGEQVNPLEKLKSLLPGVKLTDDLLKNMLDYAKENDLEGEGKEGLIQAYKNADKTEDKSKKLNESNMSDLAIEILKYLSIPGLGVAAWKNMVVPYFQGQEEADREARDGTRPKYNSSSWPSKKACPECLGRGYTGINHDRCYNCGGTGKVYDLFGDYEKS
jgi:hypothetical protein